MKTVVCAFLVALLSVAQGGQEPDVKAFTGGDWRSDRIERGLIPEPTSAILAKAKAEWEGFSDRASAWGPAPDLGEPNAPAEVSKIQFWVSPSGDDERGDGSKAKPFASVMRARDAVRKLKKGGMPEGGITVFLRGGTYPVADTMAFGSLDGGAEGRPVLYCAAPGEVPVFDGGFRVTGWKDFKGPIKVADVKTLGYTHFEPAGPRGFEVSRESTGALVTDFYLDGVRQLPAQWPNSGWKYFTCYATNNVVGIELEDWAPWLKEKNLYAKMYPACFWADLTSPVTNLNPKTGMMSVYGRAGGRNQVIRKGCAFRFQNALVAFDREGECVFDYAGGRMYAWNPEGRDAVLSDFSRPFISLWDIHDVEFRGITFRYGRSDAVNARRAVRLSFRDCVFSGFGQNGIIASEGRNMTIDGCRFRDFGYHAMRIGSGDRKTLTGGRTFIQNCDVSCAGWWKADFSFAACVDGCGATLRWNYFHDVPAATIRLNGNDMMLASNVFERCDYEAGDNGAVDIYANPTHASRIIHNVFRNCGSKDVGFVEAGHAGVRFDDAVSNQIVYGNRFEGCSPTNNVEWGFGCIQINGGRNNTIENNLFVGGWRVASVSAWPMRSWTNYFNRAGVKVMLEEVDWQGPLYAKRYPGIDKLPTMPLANRFYRNVQVGTGRFTALMGGQTDARCNFAYRELPDEATLNANPLWDPLPPESALGPRRPVVGMSEQIKRKEDQK